MDNTTPTNGVKNEKGCWYKETVFYCPQCGHETRYLCRKPAPRPEEWRDRHEFIEAWDYCDAL